MNKGPHKPGGGDDEPPQDENKLIAERRAKLAAWREQAKAKGVPAFPNASGRVSGAIQTWRIRAEARTGDGVTFVREAVVRPSQDPARPLVVLAWLEGASAPAASADARTDNNDAARP